MGMMLGVLLCAANRDFPANSTWFPADGTGDVTCVTSRRVDDAWRIGQADVLAGLVARFS